MNLNDIKISGTDIINISDSLNASLFSMKVTCTNDTVLPSENNLIVYVDRSSTPTEDRKVYTFDLSDKLNVNDKFIIEPQLKNNKLTVVSYVKKDSTDSSIVIVDTSLITLFEGTNYIYTNYSNVDIEIVYPKNCDLVNYFLNSSVFYDYIENIENENIQDLFFEDTFTKTENGMNAKLNNADINCISSPNNKFSLDTDGNLIVESITTRSSSNIVNFNNIYPNGSIYMSVNSVNPSTLFGGSWEQIQDTFLLACGLTYSNGSIGGEATHTLLENEMPSHTHTFTGSSETTSSNGSHSHNLYNDLVSGSHIGVYFASGSKWGKSAASNSVVSNGNHTHTITAKGTNSTVGENVPHNNMPPYLAVYMWKRIS